MEQVFTITKRIAKQGENSVIIIPKLLKSKLKPASIVEVQIKVLGE